MEIKYTIELKKDSQKHVQKRVKKICKYLKGKPIQYWIDYPLKQVMFDKPLTVAQLENAHSIFFCNLQKGNVIGMQLVYASYEGLISLIPILPNNENAESYFNLNNFDHIEIGNDKYGDEIYKLYKQIKGE